MLFHLAQETDLEINPMHHSVHKGSVHGLGKSQKDSSKYHPLDKLTSLNVYLKFRKLHYFKNVSPFIRDLG